MEGKGSESGEGKVPEIDGAGYTDELAEAGSEMVEEPGDRSGEGGEKGKQGEEEEEVEHWARFAVEEGKRGKQEHSDAHIVVGFEVVAQLLVPGGGEEASDKRVVVVNRVAEKIRDEEEEGLQRGIGALYYFGIRPSFRKVVAGVFEGRKELCAADAEAQSKDKGEGDKARVSSFGLQVSSEKDLEEGEGQEGNEEVSGDLGMASEELKAEDETGGDGEGPVRELGVGS